MGKELMAFYRDKVKKNWKIAFLAVVIIGLLTHLYKFTNYLPDRDSFLNLYNDQNVIGSGRWFLSIACGLGSYFDLPLVNGILSVFYIALTMVFLVELFHMENPVLIVLSAGILVTFPGVTETFLYEYTADGYMLAMLLSAAAVFFTRMQDKIGWKAYLASGICLCLSCAIYQAYISFALVLVLCHFMYELLENRWEWKQYLQWALKQVLLYAAALAAYYIIWKVCLLVQNTDANDYQGISNIGTDILATFLGGFKIALTAVATFFLQWNIFKFGLTLYSALNILFLILCAGIIVTAVVRSGLLGRKPQLLMFGVALVLFIPCCCIWAFVSKEILYRSMMLLALALLYIFALVLYERWAAPRWANIAAALLAVIVFNFALMANICYYYLNQCYEKTYATGIRIMLDIDEMEEGHSFDRIAVVGDSWTQGMLVTYDEEKQQQTPASSIGVISKYMYDNLMYEHLRITTVLNDFLGVDLEAAPLSEVLALEKDPEVMQMPLWPEEGSMIVRDDTLIIKLH